MKFASLYLSNYIGIYNGLGLYDIHIDMTKCTHRITIIRGDNGSGKSTIMKALSLFPDPNDAFIPGMPARKEVLLIDNMTYYKLTFVHGIKANGDRDTTKAYITKTFGDQIVELNENGNVSSYKDILYNELGLDANFAALSSLSTDDRGLADKKPAERKKFVNSIISSLETYNAIYKTLTKRSSNYKSMINAVVAKLNVLGDEQALTSNLEALEIKINALQANKDQAVADLSMAQSVIALLDPDGSIQLTNNKLRSEIQLAERNLTRINSQIESIVGANPGVKNVDLTAEHKQLVDRKNSLIVQNQIDKNSIESLLSQKERETDELNAKIQKVSSLKNEGNYDAIRSQLCAYEDEMRTIRESLESVGFTDIGSISKDEYILALESLRDINDQISVFKSDLNYTVIQSIVDFYLQTGNIPDRSEIAQTGKSVAMLESELSNLKEERAILLSKLGLLDKLTLRPSTCKDDNCGFIKEALEFSKSDPNKRLSDIETAITNLQHTIDTINEHNDATNRFAVIIREITKHGNIISKIPGCDMFADTRLFLDKLMSGYSFEFINKIYEYISLANQFEVYKNLASLADDCRSELKAYEGKVEVIDQLNQDIDSINATLVELLNKMTPIYAAVAERDKTIVQLQELEGVYDNLLALKDKAAPIEKELSELRSKLKVNEQSMEEISKSVEQAKVIKETINKYTLEMAPLRMDRDKLIHSVQMMQDYKTEKATLEQNYDFIETIKYYSSPTTGIQLVFMELYMGKIITLANELLGLLFGGEYVIQPFVINESEFRIPCLGSGYLNDDISSMSSSQIGMISMILSFALLYHSSTKYNVIKLDEIDGPLDYNNRVFFIDVLNKIMDIMGTEQCVMISHNAELQVDDADVILLKHDVNNTDYRRGNIIWSY